jgi:hypothetical protein
MPTEELTGTKRLNSDGGSNGKAKKKPKKPTPPGAPAAPSGKGKKPRPPGQAVARAQPADAAVTGGAPNPAGAPSSPQVAHPDAANKKMTRKQRDKENKKKQKSCRAALAGKMQSHQETPEQQQAQQPQQDAAGGGDGKKKKKKTKNKAMAAHANYAPPQASSGSGSNDDGASQAEPAGEGGNYNALEVYAENHSESEPQLLSQLRAATKAAMPTASHMTSGPLQGRLLKSLVGIKGAKRILEIGTFCGYRCVVLACAASAHGSGGSHAVHPRPVDMPSTHPLTPN